MNSKVDRLSSLSDDLVHKVLSYNDTKHAIKTSILSSRWKYTWKSIPHLNLSSDDVTSLDLNNRDVTSLAKLSEYVTSVMSSRNNEIKLSSIKFSFPFHEEVSQAFVKTMMNCVYLHNVLKLTIIRLDTEFLPLSWPINLIGPTWTHRMFHSIKITSTWDLPALTTLHLDHVEFRNKSNENPGGMFSKCPNLKSLTLTYCSYDDFTISHSQLSTLTLNKVRYSNVVNVVAPHLKDLILVKFKGDLMISAPELSSLMYASKRYFKFSADDLSSLEKVDFYISRPYKEDAPKIIDVLQQFRNVKFLTLGLEIVEVLASSVQLVSHLPSPFSKLTSSVIYPAKLHKLHGQKERPTLIYLLHKVDTYDVGDILGEAENYVLDVFPPHTKLTRFKIYQANLHSEEESQKKINMPSEEVKSYLLDGSPSATITIFSREEVLELQNALLNSVLAPKMMNELQKLLEHEKLSCENIRSQDDEQELVKEETSQIRKDVSRQIEQGKEKIDDFFSMLDLIESSLKVLPASRKDRLHACFFSLRAEAYSVTKLILDCMKIKCEEKLYGFMNLL